MLSSAVSSALGLCVIQSVYPGGGWVPNPDWCALLNEDVGDNIRMIEEVRQHTVTGMSFVWLYDKEAYKELLAKVKEGIFWSKY